MTGAHALYIPMVALAGLVIGFIWGRRSAVAEIEAKARRAESREERIAKRRAARQSREP